MTAGFNNSVMWFWYIGSFPCAARVIGLQHVVLSESAEKYLLRLCSGALRIFILKKYSDLLGKLALPV
jgi:hypothetical protein